MSATVMPMRTTVSADAADIAASRPVASGTAKRQKRDPLMKGSQFRPVLVQVPCQPRRVRNGGALGAPATWRRGVGHTLPIKRARRNMLRTGCGGKNFAGRSPFGRKLSEQAGIGFGERLGETAALGGPE